jgi:hypothetical protein
MSSHSIVFTWKLYRKLTLSRLSRYPYLMLIAGIILLYSAACDKSVNEPPVNFQTSVYVPHLTIMPDTVLPNDTFELKASVFLANGCQVFDSLKIQRDQKVIRLTYKKKEFQDDQFECNPRETFVLEKRRFSFGKAGQYQFKFQNGQGNTAKTQTVTVSSDTPQQNYEWQLRLQNTNVELPSARQLSVAYKEKLGITLPNAPGVDTIFRDTLQRMNDTLYQFAKSSVMVDSIPLDSLSYTFKTSLDSPGGNFSTLTTNNTILSGKAEIIRKGPQP